MTDALRRERERWMSLALEGARRAARGGEVPVGAVVQVAEVSGGWAKVRYGDRTGYMMAEFLDMGGQEMTEAGGTAEAAPGGELITVQRAALQAVYDALGSILQGG